MSHHDFLLIGHITRDIDPNGEFIPGGPVTYAGIKLAMDGNNVHIVTKAADNDPLLDIISGYGITVENMADPQDTHTTTYENIYNEKQERTQFILDVAEPFHTHETDHLKELALGKRTLVLPVANEIPHTFFKPLASSAEMLIAAPQGSLRNWDEEGRVFHEPFDDDYIEALRHCHVVTVSDEDMTGFTQEDHSRILHNTADTVILTNGRDGARMFQNNHAIDVPPFRLTDYEEILGYPTGNGDHMTAVIAEHAPSYLQKLSDPSTYELEMYHATTKAAFLTALKIMHRDGVSDGIGSLRTASDTRQWIFNNLQRVRNYASESRVDTSLFIEGLPHKEGMMNPYARK